MRDIQPDLRYPAEFYAGLAEGSFSSALTILPIVRKSAPIHSILDVGCGNGAWLRAAADLGIQDLTGVDAAFAVPDLPSSAAYVVGDLADATTLKTVNRSFDLAICMEVAEHLPRDSGPTFVEALTRLAPIVLFSAALPGQGGNHHINERPHRYWNDLFAKRRYRCADLIRQKVWDSDGVEWWYAQNAFVYVASDHPEAERLLRGSAPMPLEAYHPRCFETVTSNHRREVPPLRQAVQQLWPSTVDWIHARRARR